MSKAPLSRLFARADAHGVADVGEGVRCDPPRLLGARLERRVDGALVGSKLRIALPGWRQVVDDRVRDRPLEVPVPRALELALDLLGGDSTDDREDVDQVGDPLLAGPP